MKVALYTQVANKIRADIKNSILSTGERISHRKISEKYGVSKKTAADALEILQSEGLVITKPRVGSFVNTTVWSPLLDTRTPDWNKFIKKSLSVPSGNKTYSIYQCISTNPKQNLSGTSISKDFNFHKPIKKAMERALKRISDTSDLYDMNIMGMPSLRASISKHMATYGVRSEIRNIIVTAGPMEALTTVLLSFLRRGMKLLIEETSILGGSSLARFTGVDILRVKCDEEGIIPEDLIEKTRKSKADAILCLSPVNQYPTGATLTKTRRDLIMSICVSKGIPVIEYDLLRDYDRASYPRPFKSFDTNDTVIYIGAFITSYQNMKIGWINAPEQVVKHITDTKTQYEINSNTILQIIADEMFASCAYQEYIDEYSPIFTERVKLCRMLFEKYFVNTAKWSQQPNAFYQWLEFDEKINIIEMLKRIQNTFVHAGLFFNPADTNRIYINPMRVSLENLENGLKEIADVANLLNCKFVT